MIAAYFQGPERDAGGLDGTERLLLARPEIDRGLWNMTPTGCSPVAELSLDQWWALANNAAMFRDHGGTRRPPQGHTPGSIWRWSDDSFQPQAKAKQIERLLEQVARHHDMERRDLPAPITDVAIAYLDSTPVEVPNTRKRRTATGRLRPDLRLMKLFDSWKLVMQPTLQTAHEYEGAARDFVDFLGDFRSKTASRTIFSTIATRLATYSRLRPRLIALFLSPSGLIVIAAQTRHALELQRSRSGSVVFRLC